MQQVHVLAKEKLQQVRSHRHFGWGMFFLCLFLFLDLLFINYQLIFQNSDSFVKKVDVEKAEIQSQEDGGLIITDSCTDACKKEIKKQVSQALSKQNSSGSSSQGSSVNEYFIPFGTGSIASTSWQNVAGAQAYIDGSAYGAIQTVTFEASVSIPTANEIVSVQLYNSTTNQVVWNSTVTYSGGAASGLMISSPINLTPGNNLYVVQMQTQLQYPAYLDQARVHIITN